MKTLVAIPSRSRLEELRTLVRSLKSYGFGDVVVYDNGYSDDDHFLLGGEVHTRDARGWKFYEMWNDAWSSAFNQGYDALALLNDDIELHSDSLDVAFNVLMDDDSRGVVGLNYRRPLSDGSDYSAGFKKTRGTYKDGGIWGCAFVLRASCLNDVPLIDSRYNLWYGDDELFANMNKHGYQTGIAVGAPVLHEGSATTNMFPELLALTGEDEKLFRSKKF